MAVRPTTPPEPERRADQAAAEPRRVQRWDRAALPAELAPGQRTAQGYLLAHAAVAVPGVMEYQDAAGNVVLELIPEDELHDADSLASLAGLPITLHHPDEDVSPDNVGSLGVGSLGTDVEILKQTGHVRVLMNVQRRDALTAVDNGTVEVSPGYTTIVEPRSGVHPKFGRYDAVQTKRRYNHLAIVDEARGGPTVKLRADGERRAVSRMDAAPAAPPPPHPGGFTMPLLMTIAATLGLAFTTRADGQVVRTDMEGGATVSQEQLTAAIAEAIRKLQTEAQAPKPGTDMEGGEGSMTLEQAMAKITELETELAQLRQANADRAAAEAAEQEKADRARADSLAQRLRFDSATWTEETPAKQRNLDVAKHMGLVGADVPVDKADAAQLDTMIDVLDKMHPTEGAAPRGDAAAPPADPYQGLRGDPKPAPRGDAAWGGPSGRNDGEAKGTGDPMKDAVKRRNDARRASA